MTPPLVVAPDQTTLPVAVSKSWTESEQTLLDGDAGPHLAVLPHHPGDDAVDLELRAELGHLLDGGVVGEAMPTLRTARTTSP